MFGRGPLMNALMSTLSSSSNKFMKSLFKTSDCSFRMSTAPTCTISCLTPPCLDKTLGRSDVISETVALGKQHVCILPCFTPLIAPSPIRSVSMTLTFGTDSLTVCCLLSTSWLPLSLCSFTSLSDSGKNLLVSCILGDFTCS